MRLKNQNGLKFHCYLKNLMLRMKQMNLLYLKCRMNLLNLNYLRNQMSEIGLKDLIHLRYLKRHYYH
jgi:hypothetical protein